MQACSKSCGFRTNFSLVKIPFIFPSSKKGRPRVQPDLPGRKRRPRVRQAFPHRRVHQDKEYPLTRGAKGTRIFHFSVHETEENSSQISVNVYLKAVLKLRNLIRPFHFADLRIKTAVPREISLPGILWNASPASCLRPSPEMRKRKGQQPLLPQQRNGRKAHLPLRGKRCILKQPHIWRNRLPIRRWNRAPCLTPETFSIS